MPLSLVCACAHTLRAYPGGVCVWRSGDNLGTTWGTPFSPSSSSSLGLSCFCWPAHPRLASLPGKFSCLSLPPWGWSAEIKNLLLHLFFLLNNDLDQAMSSFSKCFNPHFAILLAPWNDFKWCQIICNKQQEYNEIQASSQGFHLWVQSLK